MAFFFFRSNLFENFFWKELLLLLGLLLLFENDRLLTNLLQPAKPASPAFSFVPALILVELAWLLNFLPLNFLSLAGLWLVALYLVREFVFLWLRNLFNWRLFLPQLFLSLVLIGLIMLSSSWKII